MTIKPTKRRTRTEDTWRQFRRNKTGMAGLVLLCIIVLLSLAAPLIAPHDPYDADLSRRLKPGVWSDDSPDGFYLLGTDSQGRDLFTRILYGGRTTLGVGFVALGIALSIGITFGLLAGYFGGAIDNVIMRCVDILFAFPALLLALVIAGTLGRGIDKAMIAIGITYSPQMVRVVRSGVLMIKEMEYIEAQKAIGSSHGRILLRHILPNSMAPIIVYGTLMLATAILDAAALGFLGVGAQVPSPEWGLTLSASRQYLITGAWWAATFPGIAILFSVISLNLLGDGLRDALDPRLKGGAKL
ncbi:MAG: ABC transporter permease [Candidatus Methanofastidiosa archaeon]|nr:ABC transporter permease [Candidatus Methanofastidiosa archaeon]